MATSPAPPMGITTVQYVNITVMADTNLGAYPVVSASSTASGTETLQSVFVSILCGLICYICIRHWCSLELKVYYIHKQVCFYVSKIKAGGSCDWYII